MTRTGRTTASSNGPEAGAPGPVLEDNEGRFRELDQWILHHEARLDRLSSDLADLKERLATLSALPERMDVLMIAVAEGISHVDRAEHRVRAVVQRARRELAERDFDSPGLTAEVEELRLVDGDAGEGGGLPTVRANVEAATPSRQDQLRARLRELGLSA